MGIVDLGKVRGTQTYTGNKITGSNANATVFPETGIAKAYEGDLYINTDVLSEFKGNVYECTVAGEPDAAKWIFKGSIRGPKVDTVNNLKSTSTEDALSAYQGKRLLDMMKEAGVFSRKVVVDYDGTVFGAKLTIDNVNSTFSFLINGREYKYTYEAAGKAETTTLSVSLGTNLGMEANGGILTEIRSSAANIYYYVLTDNTSAGVYSKTVDIWESVNDNKQSHEITGTIVDGDETFYDGPIKKVVNGIKKVFFPITHAKAVWFEKKNGVTVYDKIVELVSGLSNEISSRKNAVEDLSASMASEITGLRNSTSSQISNEASERKLADDTLAARMDTFTSLPSGSTSGDAELQDIRVGAGGEVYGSAGEAVRGQIGELKGDLTQFEVVRQLLDKSESHYNPNHCWNSEGGNNTYREGVSTFYIDNLKAGYYVTNIYFDACYEWTDNKTNYKPFDVNNIVKTWKYHVDDYVLYHVTSDCAVMLTVRESQARNSHPLFVRYDNVFTKFENREYAFNEIIYSGIKPYSVNNLVTIAPYDASFEVKQNADIVCDGIHDQDIINNYLNSLDDSITTVSLFFRNGSYNITKLTKSGAMGVYYGILLPKKFATVELIGETEVFYDQNSSNPCQIRGGVIFYLTPQATIGLIGTQISVIMAENDDFGMLVKMKNICTLVPNNNDIFVPIDLQYAQGCDLENVWSWVNIHPYSLEVPTTESTGIRCPTGSATSRYYLKHCQVMGFDRGFDMPGEHIVAVCCSAVRCNYSYFLAGQNHWGNNKVYHANLFLNCNEEECIRSVYIGSNDGRPTLYNFISHDIEMVESGKFAPQQRAIDISGKSTGSVSYIVTKGGVGNFSMPFWESGSGKNYTTRQGGDKLTGATGERPLHPSPNTQYFDETINKMIVFNGTNWVDFFGNDAN